MSSNLNSHGSEGSADGAENAGQIAQAAAAVAATATSLLHGDDGEDEGGQRPCGLVPLADYRSPGMPAEHVVRAVWRRIKERFDSSDADPVRADNRLQATTLKVLDEVVGPPACGPLMRDFDAAVRAWLDEPEGTFHCVVVLPPCDCTDLIGSWAQSRGHAMLRPPRRDQGNALSVVAGAVKESHATGAKNADDGESSEGSEAFMPEGEAPLLVIPRLESWFLRRRNGLLAVRALLAELQQAERRCLIGCNSWAWAFLVRAAGAALVLPSPRTFVAFDAMRLQAWFYGLAQAPAEKKHIAFRLAHSGADVLALKDDGTLCSNYLEQLAARSNGIAWVAWHLWRDALCTGIDAVEVQKANGHAGANGSQADSRPAAQDGTTTSTSSEAEAQAQDAAEAKAGAKAHARAGKAAENGVPASERTFWITGVPDPDLPHHQDDNALLVLHALLLHGTLDAAELLSVLPDATAAEVLPALLRNGFIDQHKGRLSVKPAAYPAARRALLADGFPVGEI